MENIKLYSTSLDRFHLFIEEYEEGDNVDLFVELLDKEDVRNISFHLGRLTATIDRMDTLKSWLRKAVETYLETLIEGGECDDDDDDDDDEWVYPSEETEELYF